MSNNKLLNIDYRPSDSPWIDTIWRSQSQQAGPFLSIASSRLEMVVSRYEGRMYVSVRGPETQPTVAHCPPDGEWLGILFKHGVFIPHLPTLNLVDSEVQLPGAGSQSFWLQGAAWQLPTFENAETFIERLVREELLVHDPLIEAALQNQPADLTSRQMQRRFLRATGLTHGTISQIERVRRAVSLLQQGVSILDTVELAGFADQPHLTRSFKRLIGQTPARLTPDANPMPLSFLPLTPLAE
jgi:AraC-like DNA-binding protein